MLAVGAGALWLALRLPPPEARGGGRSQALGRYLDAVLIGLLAARVGYVLRSWSDYAAAPATILALGDGGFLWWAGLPVALAWAGWRTAELPRLRRRLLEALLVGLLVWLALAFAQARWQRQAPPLPSLALTTLDGQAVTLPPAADRPRVINLWASWCPPCRRELPAFVVARARHPEVAFVLINQGEDAATVRAFLTARGLPADAVLLDPGSSAMAAAGARALPTTLFLDAAGRPQAVHLGELTLAALEDRLRRLQAAERGH